MTDALIPSAEQVVMTFSETVLDSLVEGFREFREKDRADGDDTDFGALGGIGMLVEAAQTVGPTDPGILLALAVRRLVDRETSDASS